MRDWSAYENEHARVTAEVVTPVLAEIEGMITKATAGSLDVGRRLRFETAISSAAKLATTSTRKSGRGMQDTARDVRLKAADLAKDAGAELDALVERILSETARLNLRNLDDKAFVEQRSALEGEILSTADRMERAMESIESQLAAIVWPEDDATDLVTQYDVVEALETDLEELRERAEEDLQLVQLGSAIQVINHEFDSTITSMRRSLQRLKSWSDENPEMADAYNDLRISFDHLDGYLHLFTPLNRRLYRQKVEVVGAEIFKFLADVFERRLADADVTLEATRAFEEHRAIEYPSTLYPVFVNLVDNAVWWLTDYRGKRLIELDAGPKKMIVRDSGPGVPARDRDTIFEAGFSRKPGGTGYGLFISRQVLSREGMTLELSPASPNRGAEFVIREAEEAS
jgi:signal transduction histidine kinase